jgi:hypothetical protein
MEAENEDLELEQEIALPKLTCQGSGAAYSVFHRPEGAFLTGSFACVLKFTVKELDSSTGEAEEDGYEDDYQIEEIEVWGCSLWQRHIFTHRSANHHACVCSLVPATTCVNAW